MRRYKEIRFIALLLSLVMLTSLYSGLTLSKFANMAESRDNARVAIWDINANEVTMDLFDNEYTADGEITVKSDDESNVIAPGLSGTSLFSIVNHESNIAPEVMYKLEINLDDSEIANEIINNKSIQWKLDNGDWGTWDELVSSIYLLSGDPSGIKTYQAGEFMNAFNAGKVHNISWQWLADNENNLYDTEIGNLAEYEDLTANVSVTITAVLTDVVYEGVTDDAVEVININNDIEPVTFRSDAPLNEFQEVLVNDEVVDPDNYTVTEGSTVVTFKKSFLETLPVGGYTVSIVSENKVACAKIKVVDRTYVAKGNVHNGVIPTGGTYYTGTTNVQFGNYDGGTVYNSGSDFPEPQTGDRYVYNDYEYGYNMYSSSYTWGTAEDQNGWGVVYIGNDTRPGNPLRTINEKNLIDMGYTFFENTTITTAPKIPSTVEIIEGIYWGCTNLTGTVEININPDWYGSAFKDTVKSIVLTGKSTLLNEIAATANKGNVTVKGNTSINGDYIPDNAIYYVGVTDNVVGKYGTATVTYIEGNAFPEKVQTGDIYVYGDYEYRYNMYFHDGVWNENTQLNGWGVRVRDVSKDFYGEILTSIRNRKIVTLTETFKDCVNLVNAPDIPNGVTNMARTFWGCESLETASTIPNTVMGMDYTFFNCSSLKQAPAIPSSVTAGCEYTFAGCTSLSGSIEINATPSKYENMLKDTNITEITGSCTIKDEILATRGEEEFSPNHSGTIPRGGTYYVGVQSVQYGDSDPLYYLNDYTGGIIYNTEDEFPEPQTCDVYVYGDYEYRYNMKAVVLPGSTVYWIIDETQGGWGVRVLDDSKSEYGEILTTIADKNIVSMFSTFKQCKSLINTPDIPDSVTDVNGTFQGCTSLVNAPAIPNRVTYMRQTFLGCTSLVNAPIIPEGVVDMSSAFEGCLSLVNAPIIPEGVETMYATFSSCTSLVNAPVIPDSVTDMTGTFSGCTSLVNAPVIQSSVTNMRNTFKGCTNLTGEIEINANPSVFDLVFGDTVKPIKLVGESIKLDEIAATATNGNVTFNNIVINGTLYLIKEGMTLGQWINSDYNKLGKNYFYTDTGYVLKNENSYFLSKGSDMLYSVDYIINTNDSFNWGDPATPLELQDSDIITFTVDGTTYTSLRNMDWKHWLMFESLSYNFNNKYNYEIKQNGIKISPEYLADLDGGVRGVNISDVIIANKTYGFTAVSGGSDN